MDKQTEAIEIGIIIYLQLTPYRSFHSDPDP